MRVTVSNRYFRTAALANAALLLAGALLACAVGAPEQPPPPSATNPLPSDTPIPATATATSSPTGELSPTPPMPSTTPSETQPPEDSSESTFPPADEYAWQPVATGLNQPVGLASPADGSGRLFALEQAGVIRTIQESALLAEPFLDITDRVGSNASERGLLGLAFHPEFARNGFTYVNYTDLNGDTVIARFSLSDDPSRADPSSEMILLGVPQPFPNHNGGGVAFGPDGYLYLGLGDGGAAGDPPGNAQSVDTLLGKVLRLDVNSREPYAIPADNPFAGGGGLPEIWAYGLRNPWRLAFDRLTGDLYIGDVGQGQWEEIDYLPNGSPGGANFGWDFREGAHPYENVPPAGLELVEPVAEYDHSLGCSVTGGVVYRGDQLPAWQGVYLYGDYCSGLVWGLQRAADGSWPAELLFDSGARITSFGEDQAGEVYFADHQGTVYKLVER